MSECPPSSFSARSLSLEQAKNQNEVLGGSLGQNWFISWLFCFCIIKKKEMVDFFLLTNSQFLIFSNIFWSLFVVIDWFRDCEWWRKEKNLSILAAKWFSQKALAEPSSNGRKGLI